MKIPTYLQGNGKSYTKTYWVWRNILERCSPARLDYYDRGIRVCNRWKIYENFLEDMGVRPFGMSIDRINNSEGYNPNNCRWADARTQSRNRNSVRKITCFGKTQLLSDWARELNINVSTISMRIDHYKWPIEKALGGINV